MNSYKDFLVRGKWTCVKCGACCSFITPLVENGKLPKSYLGKNGMCTNLKDNECAIYASRPDICRIDKTLGHLKDIEVAKMCKIMKDYQSEHK